ncbi:MAG: S9 family peptidase [Chloroflexi bacterium]|nr:S9 family peptidase [Chloroflexota bacterium]
MLDKEVNQFEAPYTTQVPVTEVVQGVEITDPYRWLENGESVEVRAWTETQNTYTRSWLETRPGLSELKARLSQLLKVGFVYPPIRKAKRYFFISRSGAQNQAVLYVRENGEDKPLIDPATLSEDGTIALDWWHPSENGELVAYGLSEGGSELSTLYILDIATGKNLSDSIAFTRFCNLAWLPDSSGFYYTRFPEPGSVPAGEEFYNLKVFLHKLDDAVGQDILIFQDSDPQAGLELLLADNGRYLLVTVAHSWAVTDLYWADIQQPEPVFSKLTEGLQSLNLVEESNGYLYILTNRGAPRFRVFKTSVATPAFENWREIIPEGEHPLQNLKVIGQQLVGIFLHNAISRITLYDLEGKPEKDVELPALGTVYGPMNSSKEDELLFSFTSFAYPITAYSYHIGKEQLEIFKAHPNPPGFDPSNIAVKQVWYNSKDGTPVSMFIVHKADLTVNEQCPVWLTGYGGFNVSRTPEYGSGWLRLWLEQGGIFALPNLRGGGEYGEKWHEGGMLGNKQNTFDDFIAAGEWLIANNYTNSTRLVIQGGSNGGLLVGAAITQRPDLFQVAICQVPLLDMIRYHLFLIARIWIPEYGSSEDSEQFQWMYAYSPYHHVKDGQKYPATLITTGESDGRVDPLHARKMAALLQAKADKTRPILIRIETRAGHGQGKPVSKMVDEQAEIMAFVLWQLGLEKAV